MKDLCQTCKKIDNFPDCLHKEAEIDVYTYWEGDTEHNVIKCDNYKEKKNDR